ncbi:S41 family peptidase [Pseudoalteromonas sp. R3]|uniref:S41 family peptidase n=2 Tax=Pseudoalteromonas sp. R3 TaxID=1709477 RepID=UPI000ADBB421|nr:S41 family peptidase [Pseudoalteromonas sp. R3]
MFIRICLFLVMLLSGGVQAQSRISAEERLFGLAMLWKEASYNFAYFDQVPDLDWDATYQAFIPKVLAAKSDYQYYKVLKQFLATLNDGMSYVQMNHELRNKHNALPPIMLAEAEHQAVVVGISETLASQLPLGSIITHVDGVEVKDKLQQEVFPFISSSTEHIRWHEGIKGNQGLGYGLLMGQVGTVVKVRFTTPANRAGHLSMIREADLSGVAWQLASGVMANTHSVVHKVLADNIHYVALNDFSQDSVTEQFIKLLPQLQTANGLVIDLRQNRGGNTFVAESILKYLTFHDLLGISSKMRIHNSTYKAWGKYADQFSWAKKYQDYSSGNAWLKNAPDTLRADDIDKSNKVVVPTAILTSRETSAAAESFLVYASSARHIMLIGEPTFGSTGQPLEIDLPGGGRATICSKRETFADGRDFVGIGIQPDVYVPRDIEYYFSKHDKTLSSATEWLGKQGELAQATASNMH